MPTTVRAIGAREAGANAYPGMLRRDGTLADVGVTTEIMPLNACALMTTGRNIAGSQFANVHETQEMLDFCAEHEITADIEIIDASPINDALSRVLASDVRYRFVIDNVTPAV